ncbi:hypothetical protein ACNOYE_27095 [Nannocystaceae bacterium ST9]
MARPIESRTLASLLAATLAWGWPTHGFAAPPEPPSPADEFAPVEIHPVELPEPEVELEPEVEPEPEVDPFVDLDTEAEPDADVDTEEIADDYNVLRDSAEARDARRWTRAGIASTVAGAVLIASATALGLTKPCDPLAGNNCFHDARDRAALTMGVPGGALLLGGIAMIVVGTVQKRRLRAELLVSRERIGLGISGRF